MSLTEPDVETAPWEDQAAADDAPYRRQIAYLFERSRFYRDKLGQAGFRTADAVGGLADIARLPLTEKDELRSSRHDDEPIGAHCAATPDEIVRIYSTSGTTGTPSYIPLTAGDVDVWVRTSVRSYGASGRMICSARARRSVFPVPTGMWQTPRCAKVSSAAPATNGPAL